MVELLKPIVYPDDANNQENDIEVSFQLSPDTDYILSNSNLNKQFIPFLLIEINSNSYTQIILKE
jgi:hypothetical protein